MKNERSQCTACGGWEAPGLYHPHPFCVLVQHYKGDTDRARQAINAVLDWGRKLERHSLPNEARISTVFNAESRSRKQKKPTSRKV
jgi:hypothetical protein